MLRCIQEVLVGSAGMAPLQFLPVLGCCCQRCCYVPQLSANKFHVCRRRCWLAVQAWRHCSFFLF
jgi:hypothetical protein